MEYKLRPWREEDLDSLVKYANNPKVANNLTDRFPHPYTRDNGKAFIAMAMQDDPVRIFAIEINGEAAGGIGIHPQTDVFRKNAELGYWLAEPYWGEGVITRAIREITNVAFRTFDIERVFARPFGENIGSQRALEKAGYTLEARFENTLFKNGQYRDELVYAFRRQQLTEP